MNIWPDLFLETANPNGTVRELIHWLELAPFRENLEVERFLEASNLRAGLQKEDLKWWNLTPNGLFIVKSFYTFLIDGRVKCPISRAIWNSVCPQKVNIFNWLVWRDKILSLENLAAIKCNKLPTTTCVFCYTDSESVDHLFRHYQFVQPIWSFFLRLFGLLELPSFMVDVWGSWWFKLRPCIRALEGAIVKVVVWHVWLARNDCMFNAVSLSPHSVVSKVAHILILWFSTTPTSQPAKFDEHASTIHRSLAFSGQRVDPSGGADPSEGDSVQA